MATEKGQWLKNTTLLVSESIINGVLEKGLCGVGCHGMARSFSGATDDDLNHHTIQLLQKKPSHIILHTETNDTYPLISWEILKANF